MSDQVAYRDRTTGLVAFGVLDLLIALLCLLMLALMVLAGAFAGGAPDAGPPNAMASSPAGLASAGLVYLTLAGAFAALGVGSMLGRRWARALSLIAAWFWLAGGVFGLLATIVMRPWMSKLMARTFAEAPATGPPAAEVAGMVFGCMLVVLLVSCIALPGAMVLFYRSRDVVATCEAKDPVTRWTDLRPLPVLALTLLLAWPVLTPVFLPLSRGVTVVFGQIVSGALAWLTALGIGAISAWCAWRVWHRDVRGWWAALAFWSLMSLSYVPMLFGDGYERMLEASGASQEQLEMMSEMGLPFADLWPLTAVWALALLVFFLYVKQFMKGEEGDQQLL